MGQLYQVFRLGKEGLDEDPEQADKDWQLHHQGAEAADGADAGLPVELHGFLGYPCPVAAVPVLNFLHARLQFAHAAHLANLLQGQGQGYQPYQNGKGDYRQPHVVEADNVQHHQGVEHGADYYFIPKQEEEFQRDS